MVGYLVQVVAGIAVCDNRARVGGESADVLVDGPADGAVDGVADEAVAGKLAGPEARLEVEYLVEKSIQAVPSVRAQAGTGTAAADAPFRYSRF